MEGPTPISALIHAATMVAAGIFLVARLLPLFIVIPYIMNLISLIGIITVLLGATLALAQNDIKRGLAYSTMSQLGYMMLALGMGEKPEYGFYGRFKKARARYPNCFFSSIPLLPQPFPHPLPYPIQQMLILQLPPHLQNGRSLSAGPVNIPTLSSRSRRL
ncbi:hypothetical protein GOBAR_DD21280 [Gossypium barbadense]|nr:hypothetical protein GOBAR_DD21280 [Gossypium barbadense]